MRQSRSNLSSEVKDSKRNTEEKSQADRMVSIIAKQQQVIQSLHSELLMLKSYISLEKANLSFETNCSDISVNNTSTSSSQSQIRNELEESVNQSNKKHEKFVKQLAQIFGIQSQDLIDEDILLGQVKSLKRQHDSKEPVFVERIKQTKVPIIVQKTVDRIVEKIVYRDREPQLIEKPIEKPVFKQKMGERFVERKHEEKSESSHQMNRTYSEKALKSRKEEDRQYERQDEGKYRHDNNYRRSGEAGNNMIKKRGDNSRQFNGYKKYY